MRLEKKQEINDIVIGIKESIEVSSMEELLEVLEINLRIIDSESPILNGDHACYLVAQGQEFIFLSDRCPEHLTTFTLAHELGHAILHDVELARCRQLFKTGKIEKEANYFAIKLLDPGFNPFDDEGLSIKEIARKYGVTPESIEDLE